LTRTAAEVLTRWRTEFHFENQVRDQHTGGLSWGGDPVLAPTLWVRRRRGGECICARAYALALQRMLGRTTIAMTRRYVHLTSDDLREQHLPASPVYYLSPSGDSRAGTSSDFNSVLEAPRSSIVCIRSITLQGQWRM